MYSSSGSSAPAMSGIGLLFLLAIWAGFIVLFVFVWGSIFKKAGYSFWLGLLMILPLVNLIWILVFAFSTWPIHRQLDAMKAQLGHGTAFPVVPPPR